MLDKSFIPIKPFPDFKWKWACWQCTEGLNDPVILLGVLMRMRKLEPLHVKYSSNEFAEELRDLSLATADSVGVDLARRTGERNLIRNSGQYWRAVGLLEPGDRTGLIRLTDFGRKVADHEISQSEFAATTIQTFKLPNPNVQTKEECQEWLNHRLVLHPLRLLLQIQCELYKIEPQQAYIKTNELTKIIIPLSSTKNITIQDYVKFLLWFRNDEISTIDWPDCTTNANDMRIAREFLIFLENYGYVNKTGFTIREEEKYSINTDIISEIQELVNTTIGDTSLETALDIIRITEITAEVERKRITQATHINRPNQANFRKEVLKACQRCIISNVTMPEILEAAHIKPFKYNGEDTIANGFAMRVDIHTLFDAGHLRIDVDGRIELSPKARMDYGATIPPFIVIPNFINKEFIKWRWDNYNGM